MNECESARIDKVCNRHMARMLSELEEAGCPAVFRDHVRSKLQWLRSDLKELSDTNERRG